MDLACTSRGVLNDFRRTYCTPRIVLPVLDSDLRKGLMYPKTKRDDFKVSPRGPLSLSITIHVNKRCCGLGHHGCPMVVSIENLSRNKSEMSVLLCHHDRAINAHLQCRFHSSRQLFNPTLDELLIDSSYLLSLELLAAAMPARSPGGLVQRRSSCSHLGYALYPSVHSRRAV